MTVFEILRHRGPAHKEAVSSRTNSVVISSVAVQIACLKKNKKETTEKNNSVGTLADFPFGTFAMVAYNLEGLVRYSTPCDEGQVPMKA